MMLHWKTPRIEDGDAEDYNSDEMDNSLSGDDVQFSPYVRSVLMSSIVR